MCPRVQLTQGKVKMDAAAEQAVLCVLHLRVSRRFCFCSTSWTRSLQDQILELTLNSVASNAEINLFNIISGNFQVGPQPRQKTYSPPPPQRAYFEHLTGSQEQHRSCQVRAMRYTRHRPT